MHTIVYSNSSAKLLSLDINTKKRKLYWFEFNTFVQYWSVGVKRLGRLNLANHKQHVSQAHVKYFTFEDYSARKIFANDGYTFIAVAKDESKV